MSRKPNSEKKEVAELSKLSAKQLNEVSAKELSHLTSDELTLLKFTPEKLAEISQFNADLKARKDAFKKPLKYADNPKAKLQERIAQMAMLTSNSMPEMLDPLFNKPFAECTKAQKGERAVMLMGLLTNN